MKTILKLIMLAIISLTIGGYAADAIGCNMLIPSGIIFIAALVPSKATGAFAFGLEVEIWQKDIEGALFEDNSFLNDVTIEDQYVLAGKVVHIPQAGTPAVVVKDRTNLPANVTVRNDTDVTYNLHEFTTDPRKIADADKAELSYSKRDSLINDDKGALSEAVAEDALFIWASGLPASAILATTGGSVLASADGATGNRKAAQLKDLQTMRTKLRKQRAWKGGQMYALIPSEMLAQMFPADSAITATYAQNLTEQERRDGVVYKAHGFIIKERGSVLRYAANGTLKDVSALGAATDNEGALFWNKAALARAKGTIKMFDNPGEATYYGDIISFLVRFGGRRRREDNKGVAVLRQAAVPAQED